MPSIYKQEELEQVKQACEHWLKYFAPKEYVDDVWNRDLIFNHIKYKCAGETTTATLNQACQANYANLHGLGVAHTPEQKLARAKEVAEKAEADRLQERSEQNVKVATDFLRNRAPLGLLVNGDFYPASADKILAFLQRNFPNQPITDEMLTSAVETLGFTDGVPGGSLDWFDKSDAAIRFRNAPPPPPRRLSKQAQIDAGMKIPESQRSHTKDTKMKNPIEALRPVARKITGQMTDPDMVSADAIRVTTRTGKWDHAFNDNLKKIIAHNPDGSPNGKETLRLRTAAASEYERRRNRDGGQRG